MGEGESREGGIGGGKEKGGRAEVKAWKEAVT